VKDVEEYMNEQSDLYHVDAQEDIVLDRADILAFIIALFQVIFPIVLLVLASFTAVLLVMQFIWLR
jgi:hypothetical protein